MALSAAAALASSRAPAWPVHRLRIGLPPPRAPRRPIHRPYSFCGTRNRSIHLAYPAKGITTSVISKKEADSLARMGNARSNSVYMALFSDGDYDIPTPTTVASARQTFVHLKYESKR